MRSIPKNKDDFIYMMSKIGFSFIRGCFVYLFLAKHSNVPFLGRGVKLISKKKLRVGKFVWIGHCCYFDLDSNQINIIGSGSTIREFSVIQCRSGLNLRGDKLVIGENVFIGPFSKIGVGGPVTISGGCQIGSHFSINAETHEERDGNFTSGHVSRKGVFIGENVWIGDKVTILDGVSIGNSCVIGAGAVVTKSFPAASKIVGVPARRVEKK